MIVGLIDGIASVVAAIPGGVAPGSAVPPCYHAVAFVNDTLSHGTLGDGLLSLNEAILLHNGQLSFAQLSAAEQAQLSLIPGTGATTDVTWIDIDGSNTPVITIQQDLAPVLDTSFGLLIKGFSDPPVLDFSGPGVLHGMIAPANSLTLQDLVFSGGPFGVDVTQTDASGQVGCALIGVDFVGQAQFGVRVTAVTPNATGRLVLENCRFENVPSAIVFDETPAGRTTIFEAHQVDIVGASFGIDAALGSGGSTRYTFDRVTVEASQRGIRIGRSPTANRQTFLEGSFVRVRSPQCALIDCHPSGLTWALLNLWDLKAPLGGTALQLGAPGAAWFGELNELTLEGAATFGAGAGGQPITLHNLRLKDGPATLATSVTQPMTLRDSRCDNSAVTVAAGTVTMNGCCFVGGSLQATAGAAAMLTGCHAPTVGANVQVSAPLPAPQLGSMSIVPEDVLVGGSVQLNIDLPPGLIAVFALGFTDPTPTLLAPPLHFYFDTASYVMVPGAYLLQQGFTWPVPNGLTFVGIDLVAHAAVLPLAGVQAPWLQLPPPKRFVLR